MDLSETTVTRILTRSGGYLLPVASHSLQPYRGCALGNSLCGVGCYVRHSWYVTRGREWGGFVEARANAAEAYATEYESERHWARGARGRFGVFLSSATEPFQPAERKHRVTRRVLEAMVDQPPDVLILQSHSHHVADYVDLYPTLARRCAEAGGEMRIHISIESDRDALPGVPPAASPVAKRMEAAATLRAAGLRVVATVSPLLPIDDPVRFFKSLAEVADAVVIDHFIGGDGSRNGSRTRRTPLPVAMAAAQPRSVYLDYQDEMVAVARQCFPAGCVGVSVDGFAGRFLSAGVSSPCRDQSPPCKSCSLPSR